MKVDCHQTFDPTFILFSCVKNNIELVRLARALASEVNISTWGNTNLDNLTAFNVIRQDGQTGMCMINVWDEKFQDKQDRAT